MAKLLTETADYDEDGSWGRASEGWPGVKGDKAHDMYVFANMTNAAPYGSYVLMSEKGCYGATESYLRVHADHIAQLTSAFKAAGRPKAEESIRRKQKSGKQYAPKWW